MDAIPQERATLPVRYVGSGDDRFELHGGHGREPAGESLHVGGQHRAGPDRLREQQIVAGARTRLTKQLLFARTVTVHREAYRQEITDRRMPTEERDAECVESDTDSSHEHHDLSVGKDDRRII